MGLRAGKAAKHGFPDVRVVGFFVRVEVFACFRVFCTVWRVFLGCWALWDALGPLLERFGALWGRSWDPFDHVLDSLGALLGAL